MKNVCDFCFFLAKAKNLKFYISVKNSILHVIYNFYFYSGVSLCCSECSMNHSDQYTRYLHCKRPKIKYVCIGPPKMAWPKADALFQIDIAGL